MDLKAKYSIWYSEKLKEIKTLISNFIDENLKCYEGKDFILKYEGFAKRLLTQILSSQNSNSDDKTSKILDEIIAFLESIDMYDPIFAEKLKIQHSSIETVIYLCSKIDVIDQEKWRKVDKLVSKVTDIDKFISYESKSIVQSIIELKKEEIFSKNL